MVMTPNIRIQILISFLLTAACNGVEHRFSMPTTEQTFYQNSENVTQRKIDILWVIDNSGSMAPFQLSLAQNFQEFLQAFVQKNYDFHLAVTTTDAYLAGSQFRNDRSLSLLKDGNSGVPTGFPVMDPSTPDLLGVFVNNALQGTQGSGDERAFSSIAETLENPANNSFLREGSFLAVIILSDEDDFSNPYRPERTTSNAASNPDQDYSAPGLESVNSYISYLDRKTNSTGLQNRNYNVSVIGVTDQACLLQHQAQTAGTILGKRMMELAEKTGGISGSICSSTYSTVLQSIQKRIIELSTEFPLNRKPKLGTIRVYVNGTLLSQDSENGWTYNPNSNSILFHGNGIPPQAAAVSVVFDPIEALKPHEASKAPTLPVFSTLLENPSWAFFEDVPN